MSFVPDFEHITNQLLILLVGDDRQNSEGKSLLSNSHSACAAPTPCKENQKGEKKIQDQEERTEMHRDRERERMEKKTMRGR